MYFQVSYSQLVQFSLEMAQNSMRKAIADLCKISPLRVVDIHVRIYVVIPIEKIR